MAHQQTAGIGRRGRAWAFQPGNFAASARIAPAGSLDAFAQYSFVAALALHDALAAIVGHGADIALKWPNDVLINGKKACGILLETTPRREGHELIVGIGVNLKHAPSQSLLEPGATPPGSLAELTGISVSPEGFLGTLANAFATRDDNLRRHGFAETRADWLARASGLGTRIKARLPNACHEGVFEDLDSTGALVLRTDTARLVLPAADIYFVRD